MLSDGRATPSIALSMAYLDPHLTHGSYKLVPRRILDRFSRFCRAHTCDLHTPTDRQTTLRAMSVAIHRYMPCGPKTNTRW